MLHSHVLFPLISIHAPREGGDFKLRQDCSIRVISIHAPARGATAGVRISNSVHMDFNPRPREGGDVTLSILSQKTL